MCMHAYVTCSTLVEILCWTGVELEPTFAPVLKRTISYLKKLAVATAAEV